MIFAELLMALAAGAGILIAVLGLLIELVGSVLFLLVEVLGLIFGSGGDAPKRQRPSRLLAISRSKWFRHARIIACGCLLLTLLAGVILNLFFFDTTVRWILRQGESMSGTHVQFHSATGNLFTGRIELHNVKLSRNQHPATT